MPLGELSDEEYRLGERPLRSSREGRAESCEREFVGVLALHDCAIYGQKDERHDGQSCLDRLLRPMVGLAGIGPATPTLKVSCSTN